MLHAVPTPALSAGSPRPPSSCRAPRRRTLALAATWVLALAAAAPVQAQQGVDMTTGLVDFDTWSRYGSAIATQDTPGNGFTYKQLVLTSSGTGGQSGSAFAPTALALDFNQGFSFAFNFFIPTPPPSGNGVRGDGMTFTLSDVGALGGAGTGLGYEGLSNSSVAFAIDTFDFGGPGEAISPSVQILTGGNITPLAFTETGLGDAIRDPNYQWRATVDYTPSGLDDFSGMLTGTITHLNLGSFAVSAQVNFSDLGLAGSPVYYGFTAANGLAEDGHWITSAAPVPEPGTWAMMAVGLLGLGGLARRRQASSGHPALT